MTDCRICGKPFDETAPQETVFQEAGNWLAEEVWQDDGAICPQCLENRARLALMYCLELDG